MFGTLLNNRMLCELVRESKITINPFDGKRAKTAHYPLSPGRVMSVENELRTAVVHDFEMDDETYVFPPMSHRIIEIKEHIVLPHGIVGQFIPSSNLVEQGFGLVAGRIEYPFGVGGQKVRFGLKNLLETNNQLKATDLVAYVQFFDLRSLGSDTADLTERDEEILQIRVHEALANKLRHAKDDGPNYEVDMED